MERLGSTGGNSVGNEEYNTGWGEVAALADEQNLGDDSEEYDDMGSGQEEDEPSSGHYTQAHYYLAVGVRKFVGVV